MATDRSFLPERPRPAARLYDEPEADRLRQITLMLRARGWSDDTILLLKVLVTMGGAFLVASVLASILNALGLAPYILS